MGFTPKYSLVLRTRRNSWQRGRHTRMMTESEFALLCQGLALKPEVITMIHKIRASTRISRVQGSSPGLAGSKHIEPKLRIESTVELALIGELERDDTVLEYYPQPSTLVLDYLGGCGRNLRSSHVPDYFVISRTSAGWIEAIHQQRLLTLSQEQPNRYRLENDIWVCPPGIAYANRLGSQYTVHCH